MTKIFKIESLARIGETAQEFVRFVSESAELQSNLFAFYGRMGAGKTTFIKAICDALGVRDTVNSPTFTIINEYRSAKGFPIYHFDFYRITKIREAYDIGVEDYFRGEGLCLMEWPERIEEILPEDTIKVDIVVNADMSRTVTLSDGRRI